MMDKDAKFKKQAYLGEWASLLPTVEHQVGTNRTCLVGHATPAMASFSQLSDLNHSAYASKWGYHRLMYRGYLTGTQFLNPRYGKDQPLQRYGLFWQKPWAVRDALSRRDDSGRPLCEWVLWLDGDTLITDMSRSIADVLKRYPENKDIVLAREEANKPGTKPLNIINAGVYFIRNTETGRGFIQKVLDLYNPNIEMAYADQDAVVQAALHIDDLRAVDVQSLSWEQIEARLDDDIALAPARDFNSFYPAYAGDHTEAGHWSPGDFLAHFAGQKPDVRRDLMLKILRQQSRKGL